MSAYLATGVADSGCVKTVSFRVNKAVKNDFRFMFREGLVSRVLPAS